MKKFNPDLLANAKSRAKLNAFLFENLYVNIPQTLFYTIEIEFEKFLFEEQLIETIVELSFIRMNIKSLTELENKIFEFPINPVEGHIDGSIYLSDIHSPFDVKKIEFQSWKNDSLDTVLHYDIDFEFENTGYKKMTDAVLRVSLSRGVLTIHSAIHSAENFNSNHTKQLISRFASLKDYDEPEISNGQVALRMLSGNYG